jgi:hypothetical protein
MDVKDLDATVEWSPDHAERTVVAEGYPQHRVRIIWDHDNWDALDSDAMSAIVKFGHGETELHTGCGNEMDIDALGRAWGYFDDDEKLVRWLVMTGQAYAAQVVQLPGWNSWGFLIAATPEWVRRIWTPEGEATTPEHIAQAVAALDEEAATVREWIEGNVYRLIPETLVTVTETVKNTSGAVVYADEYEEWRECDDCPSIGGYIGDQWAITEAKEVLASIIGDDR